MQERTQLGTSSPEKGHVEMFGEERKRWGTEICAAVTKSGEKKKLIICRLLLPVQISKQAQVVM